jgi:succinate dehydrogenase / fumarate reductase iron-sulfur subunit
MAQRTFKIYRYDPDKDAKPYMQDYRVPLEPSDSMLLDVLVRIKAMDDSLTLRRSCREGVCGSDAMNINGRNGLACITPLASLGDVVTLRPLPGLPVVRDLIVDMSQFFKQYHSVKPYLTNDEPPPEKERLQTPRSARSWTACTSASCAPAAAPPAPRSGGIRTSSSARPDCCRPTDSWPIRASRPPASAWTTSRIPTGCSAVIRS